MSGPRLGSPGGVRSSARRLSRAATAGETRPVSAAARRKIVIASPVSGLGHVHDQLGDVGRGRAVPQQHVHGPAAQALPDRPRQGRVRRLADQVVPEGHPVAVLDHQPGRQRLAQRREDLGRARRRRERPVRRPRTGGRARTPAAGCPWRRPTAGRGGSRPSRGVERQPRPDQAGGPVADLHQILLAQAAQQFGQQERLPVNLGQRRQQGGSGTPPSRSAATPATARLVQRAQR